jgi:hypothetical protein
MLLPLRSSGLAARTKSDTLAGIMALASIVPIPDGLLCEYLRPLNQDKFILRYSRQSADHDADS